jgi:rhodanese-related sulfurtransferase
MKQFFILSFLFVAGLSSCNSQANTKGYTDLDVPAFKAKMAEPAIVVLDVRTPEETAEGMIAGAIAIDYEADNFETEVDKLDKNKTYLVYCRSGSRSSEAGDIMVQKGFKHVFNLKGGYIAWTGKE